MNNKIDFNNRDACQKYLASSFHKLIDFLRILVKNNTKLLKSIGETYEKTLINFLSYIPNKYIPDIYKIIETIFILVTCVDINKLIECKDLLNSIIGHHEIKEGKTKINKIKEILIIQIENKFKEPSDCEFLKSLLGKLDPVFNSLMYVIENIPQCLENLKLYNVVSDIF